MAYLTLPTSEDNTCFKFIGVSTTSNIGNNSNLEHTSLLSSYDESAVDTCSFYSGPSDSTIFAFGENYDSSSSLAYDGSESCGSIAYSGSGETCGSIASSSSGSVSSGGCCYSC